jgi:hypothetical protein
MRSHHRQPSIVAVFRVWWRLSLGLCLSLGVGCSSSDSQPTATAPAAARAAESETPQNTATTKHAAEELWLACYVNGAKVGYTHTKIEPIETAGRQQIRYASDDQLTVRRFGNKTEVRTKLVSLETREGQVLEFRSEIQMGPGVVVTEGRYHDGQLLIETTAEGKQQTDRIAWNPGWGGFFADRQSLRRQPMQPREQRRLQAPLPVILQVGEIRLEAGGYEATKLLSETRQLLRIDVTTEVEATKPRKTQSAGRLRKTQMKSILWTDETGEVWKTRDLQLGLEAFLTTRDVALGVNAESGFDLGEASMVRVNRPLERPHHTRRVVYRARLKDGDVHALFAEGPTQSVRRIDDHTAEITVQAIRPGQTEAPAAGDRPTEADTESSPMIQSDDPRVVQLAREPSPDETDPWTLACALEAYVKQKIRLKNYSTAMATAAEVAKTLEGDCTEHAMLLAALCRARKLPARVAVGLVYYAPEQAFAYHMWTEAWIESRWIPLDATLGLGGIGAAHLKLTSTNLSGANAYGDLLPVVQAIGRLELEIISSQ